MGSLNQFIERVGAQPIKKGSLTLVDRDSATRILEICAKEGVRILGIDGFSVADGKIIPVIDAIGDFSNAATAAESVADARHFFEKVDTPGLIFELELQ